MIYAIESGEENLSRIWASILNIRPELAVGCVAQIDEALNDPWGRPDNSIFDRISLIDLCPAECLSLSRSFIDNKVNAVSFRNIGFSYDRGDQFAFAVIEKHGNRSDLDRLRAVSVGHSWAHLAASALKTLDR